MYNNILEEKNYIYYMIHLKLYKDHRLNERVVTDDIPIPPELQLLCVYVMEGVGGSCQDFKVGQLYKETIN